MAQDPKTVVRRTPWPSTTSWPVATPIQPSVVYASPDPDALDAQYADGSGFTYAREGHPNASVLAQKIDWLEGCEGGIITGSGMSAIGAVFLGCLSSGDHVLGGDQLYGRTLRVMSDDLPRFGVETSLADATDVKSMRHALRPNTKMIFIEVISNPTIRVADLKGIAELAKKAGALLVVDNTFTTPSAIKPIEHGADIVIHSVTKLLAGHSDATLGYVVARDKALMEAINDANKSWGLTPSPFDCWLAERGLYSFDLRFAQSQKNAANLAEALSEHPKVKRVLYPTRPDHPDHNRAVGLIGKNGGNMLSFEVDGGRSSANAFTRAAKNIAFAPTLGDIGTTISHPASSSHRSLTSAQREALGVSEGFFRISAGVEPIEILIEEFLAALEAV